MVVARNLSWLHVIFNELQIICLEWVVVNVHCRSRPGIIMLWGLEFWVIASVKLLYVCWIGVYGLFGEQNCYGMLWVVLGCVSSSKSRVDVAMCWLCCLGIEYDLDFGCVLGQYMFFRLGPSPFLPMAHCPLMLTLPQLSHISSSTSFPPFLLLVIGFGLPPQTKPPLFHRSIGCV